MTHFEQKSNNPPKKHYQITVNKVVHDYIMEYDAANEKNETAPSDMKKSLKYVT